MADKVPDENKREGSDDLQEPANKKPRDDAGPSQGPKPVENFQDVGDRLPECPIKDCDWKICDLISDEVANEVSSFLKKYYSVYGGSWGRIFNEDNKVKYEYQYSKDYLLWLLGTSDFGMDWNIVVQDKSTKELVAFIAAVPKHLKRYVKEVHYQSDKDDHVSDEDDHVSDEDDHVSDKDDPVSDGYDTVSDEKNDSIVNSNDSSVGSNSISNDSIVEENDSNDPIVEEEVSTITLKAARLLYNVSTEGEPHELLKKALRFANMKGYDFFEVPNIMNIRDQVLKDLKFREYGQYYFARLHKKLEPKQVSFTARSLAPEK